jgi:hypothetical protein
MNPTPEDLGINPCPASGQGCHSWMYGAAHALVANDYDNEFIDQWITHYLQRPPQPREIADTVANVRAEVEGLIEPRPRVSLKRSFEQDRLDALTQDGPLPVGEFIQSSPVPVAEVTTSEFLRRLYPKQVNAIFTDPQSQGKLVWNEKIPEDAVNAAVNNNTAGAWIMVNPIEGPLKPIPRLGKKSRRAEENLTAYEYLLVESDAVEMELWLRVLSKLDLPIVSVTTSGSKSAHALVRVSQKDRDGYLLKASEIADLVVPLGADPAAMSAVRLTRVPGCVRKDTGKPQQLIYFNPEAGILNPSNSTELEVSHDSSESSQENTNEESDESSDNSSDTDSSNSSTTANKTGRFEDIYYDGKTFFMKAADGIWRYEMVAMLSSELKCRGFSDRAPKGAAMSPMDKAKAFIREHRRVDGAGPSLYNPNELWFEGGKKYLNTAKNVRITKAAETAAAWGDGFPRYAAILDNVFAHPDYKEIFLFWLKRFYESAEQGKLCMGQAMILVGPVHCFKTFLIERLLAPAMGGYADLSSVVSGEGNGFNADLFQSPLAIIDDSRAAESESALQRYASYVKKLVAHGKHKYHEKYLTPIMVEWRGRVVIAANDDPVSIKAVPALDISNEDKIIALALKTYEEGPIVEELKDVETELPALLAWIKAWDVPPKYIDAANRYVVRSYIADEVREKIDASGRHAELRDTLNAWWDRRDGNEWEGTTVDLHQSLNDTFDNNSLTREWPVRLLSARLMQLSTRGDSNVVLLNRRYGRQKVYRWRLTRPTADPVEPESNDPF